MAEGGRPGPALRVIVDARLAAGQAGGVQQYVIGLASGLLGLADGDESYRFLELPGGGDWLGPYVPDGLRIEAAGQVPGPRSALAATARRVATRTPGLARVVRRMRERAASSGPIALHRSDGVVEAAGAEVMHFTYSGAFLTGVPSIYQPWDLQHLHLPEFFTPAALRWRETAYPAFARQAALVVVASDWARRDVVRHLGVPVDKVAVVAVPPPIGFYPVPDAAAIEAVRRAHALPDRFLYYPAQTWPHKNHLRLLEAVAALRDERGLEVRVVLSGGRTEHHARIAEAVRRLRLAGSVRFVGFVEPVEVQALYRLARGLVFPSLFEGWGLPVVEAFALGVPVACSNVTSLPELVGDAALVFDPLDPAAIAEAMARLWVDDELCEALGRRGRAVAARLDWGRTARVFRAHYRAIAGRGLSAEDRTLVAASLGAGGA